MECTSVRAMGKPQQESGNQRRNWNPMEELKLCCRTKNLSRGKEIHEEIGPVSCVYVATALVRMYTTCGSMTDAYRVFSNINRPDVVLWTALIAGYAENGQGNTALDLFERMRSKSCAPNSFTFVAALKACTSLALDENGNGKAVALKRGKQIHSKIGSLPDVHVQSALINMYAKCGSMTDAHQAFVDMKQPNVVAWTSLILGYADNGKGGTALELFKKMRLQCAPNSLAFIAALKACTSLGASQNDMERAEGLALGREIHSQIGCPEVRVLNTLINMYARCGSMIEAYHVFAGIGEPTIVSWNALISGYAANGEGNIALDMFARMKDQGPEPNSLTFVAALKACTSLSFDQNECLQQGKKIHSQVGGHLNIYVQNTLIDMYATVGSMVDAREVFDNTKRPNVISWNSLISGYADNGDADTALDLFARMNSGAYAPDSITFIAVLKACTVLALENEGGKAEYLERGREIHLQIGSCISEAHLQSALIDMYAKCGSMSDAQQVFDGVKQPDVVLWNILILGYAKNGQAVTALDCYAKMRSQGCAPSCITFLGALRACALVGAFETGKNIHAELDPEVERNARVVSGLVDFYAKCENLVEAREIFDSHPRTRNLATWNALLAGYSCLGDTNSAFALFDDMQEAGFRPDSVTFICLLRCCRHAGLAEKGVDCLEAMSSKYGIAPTLEHYSCLIDTLGHLNKLYDAMALLRRMPCCPTAETWMTMLGACHKWKNVETGRLAFGSVLGQDGTNALAYMLMAQIYGGRGMRQKEEMLLAMGQELKTSVKPEQTEFRKAASPSDG